MERNFLLLQPDAEDNLFISGVLKSPLDLAKEIILSLFQGQYAVTSKHLDDIKLYSAGLNRAIALESAYALAGYAKTQFTFQQFFHNSFKARQGKVLEALMQHILIAFKFCEEVPLKPSNQQELTKRLFRLTEVSKRDIDVLGYNQEKQRSIAIQLRSRDNTGGTTAKGSLADWIKYFLHDKIEPQEPLLYIVGIWDGMDQQQKKSTIDKLWQSLQDMIPTNETAFTQDIEQGIQLTNLLHIRLCYGYTSILQAVYDWFEFQDVSMLNAVNTTVNRLMNWDDLWVSYAVASLEIGQLHTRKQTNISILNEKVPASEFVMAQDQDIHIFVRDLASQIALQWKENTLPLPSLQENIFYLRDLLYLKAIYHRFSRKDIRDILKDINK